MGGGETKEGLEFNRGYLGTYPHPATNVGPGVFPRLLELALTVRKAIGSRSLLCSCTGFRLRLFHQPTRRAIVIHDSSRN